MPTWHLGEENETFLHVCGLGVHGDGTFTRNHVTPGGVIFTLDTYDYEVVVNGMLGNNAFFEGWGFTLHRDWRKNSTFSAAVQAMLDVDNPVIVENVTANGGADGGASGGFSVEMPVPDNAITDLLLEEWVQGTATNTYDLECDPRPGGSWDPNQITVKGVDGSSDI